MMCCLLVRDIIFNRGLTQLMKSRVVDAHTARHLFYECLKGDLMRGRTVILVSHHVQLCAPSAGYIVALDNGRVIFEGNRDAFRSSDVLNTLVQSGATDSTDDKEETAVTGVEEAISEKNLPNGNGEGSSETTSTSGTTAIDPEVKPEKNKVPRKLIEEEKRAVGRIGKDIWAAYIGACGGYGYWILFALALMLAALSPVFENGWLRYAMRTTSVTRS